VGRPSLRPKVLTFALTMLLAWPWNVMLSAAESFQDARQDPLGIVYAQGNLRLDRLSRAGRDHPPQGRSVIAPDYDCDEEEGDDGSLASQAWDFASVPVPFRVELPEASPSTRVSPVLNLTRDHHRRLRC
jgi:hypothetical protein